MNTTNVLKDFDGCATIHCALKSAYVRWVKHSILFRSKRHPKEIGVEKFTKSASILPPGDKLALPRKTNPRPRSSFFMPKS